MFRAIKSKRSYKTSALILLFCVFMTSTLHTDQPALAQSSLAKQQAGWVSDVYGLRHFNGLRCPDVVGSLFRVKALSANADRMAGCIYSGSDGMRAVLRQHIQGSGKQSAQSFLTAYQNSGFQQVALSGAAASGISFITNDWSSGTQCETLWHFSGVKADFSLWMMYALPLQETEVEPAVKAFIDILNRQN